MEALRVIPHWEHQSTKCVVNDTKNKRPMTDTVIKPIEPSPIFDPMQPSTSAAMDLDMTPYRSMKRQNHRSTPCENKTTANTNRSIGSNTTPTSEPDRRPEAPAVPNDTATQAPVTADAKPLPKRRHSTQKKTSLTNTKAIRMDGDHADDANSKQTARTTVADRREMDTHTTKRVIGLDINATIPCSGLTALMMACEAGHSICTRHLLTVDNIDVNMKDKKNETALIKACRSRNGYSCVYEMMTAVPDRIPDLDLNVVDNTGMTALMHACRHDNSGCVEKILRMAGGRILWDDEGRQPGREHLNLYLGLKNNEGMTALQIACANGHDLCVRLLINCGLEEIAAARYTTTKPSSSLSQEKAKATKDSVTVSATTSAPETAKTDSYTVPNISWGIHTLTLDPPVGQATTKPEAEPEPRHDRTGCDDDDYYYDEDSDFEVLTTSRSAQSSILALASQPDLPALPH